MTQLLLAVPASFSSVGVPAAPFGSSSLLTHQRRQRRMPKCPSHPHGKPGWGFWLLVASWPRPDHRSHLENEEQVEDRVCARPRVSFYLVLSPSFRKCFSELCQSVCDSASQVKKDQRGKKQNNRERISHLLLHSLKYFQQPDLGQAKARSPRVHPGHPHVSHVKNHTKTVGLPRQNDGKTRVY